MNPQPAIKVDVLDVGCSRCKARPGDPCTDIDPRTDEVTVRKRPHQVRYEYRDTVVENAQGTSDTARWYRWKIRHGKLMPREERKHGSLSGYTQHRRLGEEACDECAKAARAVWRRQYHEQKETAK